MTDPRGIRLNNPGNLRFGPKWQGLADIQADPAFCAFKTPQWGIRAIARTILTYQSAYGLSTVAGIIGRWAPANENDTKAYVTAVSVEMGVDETQPLDVDSVAVMLPLVRAIIRHENGEDPYSDSLVLEALHMAGVADAKPKPLTKQGGFIAQTGTAIAIPAAAAAQYAPTVKSWADQVADYTGVPIFAHLHSWLLGIAGALVVVGIVATVLKHRAGV